MFGEKTDTKMHNVIAGLKSNDVPFDVFSGEEVRSKRLKIISSICTPIYLGE